MPVTGCGFQKWTGRPLIALRGGRALYVGPGLDLAPHRNLAATVAVALETPFQIQFLDAGSPNRAQETMVALIPTSTLHHLRASGCMAFIYLDAMSDDIAAMTSACLGLVSSQIRSAVQESSNPLDAAALLGALALGPRAPQDSRIANIVRIIDRRPQAFATVALAAGAAGLSPSRFQALFRATTGMPFRRYRLWRRMASVLSSVASGTTLTMAALDAGFSSSAHLSSTFKSMFGMTPSALLATGVRIDFDEQCAAPPLQKRSSAL
jgi:AraC-like DNA-binding protein